MIQFCCAECGLEKLNQEIPHDWKNEKVAVIVENIQITEIWKAKFVYIWAHLSNCVYSIMSRIFYQPLWGYFWLS